MWNQGRSDLREQVSFQEKMKLILHIAFVSHEPSSVLDSNYTKTSMYNIQTFEFHLIHAKISVSQTFLKGYKYIGCLNPLLNTY